VGGIPGARRHVGGLPRARRRCVGVFWEALIYSLGDAESSLGDAESSLGDAESSLGDAESSLGDAESSLGDAESSLCDAESSLGDATSSLGDAESSLGDAESSLGDAESSLGDAESSLGDAESSLGDVQSWEADVTAAHNAEVELEERRNERKEAIVQINRDTRDERDRTHSLRDRRAAQVRAVSMLTPDRCGLAPCQGRVGTPNIPISETTKFAVAPPRPAQPVEPPQQIRPDS
jgi:DNA repair ATPase RecN